MNFFSLIRTIYLRVSTKPPPNDAKRPFPVDVHRSKTLLLKLAILAGKRGSRRHSNTSFSANVEEAKTRYQMLEVLSFWDRESASLKVTVLTFLVKNSKLKLSGESIF